jgi:hypothetical protein
MYKVALGHKQVVVSRLYRDNFSMHNVLINDNFLYVVNDLTTLAFSYLSH